MQNYYPNFLQRNRAIHNSEIFFSYPTRQTTGGVLAVKYPKDIKNYKYGVLQIFED